MSGASFPGRGQDGDEPPPAGPARDGAADDWDGDASMAAFLADIEAGREEVPEPWSSPACTVSLGEATDVDLAALGAMAEAGGLAGQAFPRGDAADGMRPGAVLAGLTGSAVQDLAALADGELLGTVSAARRLAAWAAHLELAAVGEFGRRRAEEFEASKARKEPKGQRDGEFADQELAYEITASADAAAEELTLAADLRSRLPETMAALAAGTIDRFRAVLIHRGTCCLSDAGAAEAEAILAAAAPSLTYAQLRKKAAALEMRLDPEGFRRRKEQARQRGRRIEARREDSGNAWLAGRELDPEEAMAAKAQLDADAVALRNAGLEGSLRELRVTAYLDRLRGRDPLDRATRPHDRQDPQGRQDGQDGHPDDALTPDPVAGHGHDQAGEDHPCPDRDPNARNDGEGCRNDDAGWDDEDDEGRPGGGGGPKGPGTPAGGLAPLPALINLIVPAGTLLGWSTAPGEAGTWGLTDLGDTRRIVEAASNHPRSRWCVTVVDERDGTAVAHGCARGQHPWTPDSENAHPDQQHGGGGGRDGPGGTRDGTSPPGPARQQPGPDARQAARLAELLRRLNVTLAPIAKGHCDHKHQEDRYTPSRKLKHLTRARTARCSAPGCGAQAINCDLDHSLPYPFGITCECGLGPLCRRHHRCKQAPGWKLEQPEPGVMRWTTPSGRVYTTTPTIYST